MLILDSIDKVLWVLPFLAVLDVVAALYVKSLGTPYSGYDVGLFAKLLFTTSQTYLYIHVFVYLIVAFGIITALLYVKSRLNPSCAVGRMGLLAVVGITCVVYVVLSEGFIINFFLQPILDRGIDLFWLAGVVYFAAAFSVGFQIWHDVIAWMRSNGKK